MINGVLVERTVKDVLPALETNSVGLKKVLDELVKQYKRQQEEMEKWKVSIAFSGYLLLACISSVELDLLLLRIFISVHNANSRLDLEKEQHPGSPAVGVVLVMISIGAPRQWQDSVPDVRLDSVHRHCS